MASSHLPAPVAVSDTQWARVSPLLVRGDAALALARGDLRAILSALVYRAATGCSWGELPPAYPAADLVRAVYRRWQRLGLLNSLSAALLVQLSDLAETPAFVAMSVRTPVAGVDETA